MSGANSCLRKVAELGWSKRSRPTHYRTAAWIPSRQIWRSVTKPICATTELEFKSSKTLGSAAFACWPTTPRRRTPLFTAGLIWRSSIRFRFCLRPTNTTHTIWQPNATRWGINCRMLNKVVRLEPSRQIDVGEFGGRR